MLDTASLVLYTVIGIISVNAAMLLADKYDYAPPLELFINLLKIKMKDRAVD